MRSEWYDSCASLIAFAKSSDIAFNEVRKFQQTIVRLFSLLNAVALTEIATLSEENFPLIDIEGLSKDALSYLCSPLSHGRKTEVVFQWIKLTICRNNKTGLIGVPAPILTRVFQELGAGLTKYHDAVQIIIWPFPFPYAQLCVGLINLHMVLTPILFCKVTTNPVATFCLTFVAILSIKGLDVIAEELENPFGSDANDLPCLAMHRDMNHDLIMLLDERSWQAPELVPEAITSVAQLYEANRRDNMGISFTDIDWAGWRSGSGKESHRKSRHHKGTGHHHKEEEIVFEPKAMEMFHVTDHLSSSETRHRIVQNWVQQSAEPGVKVQLAEIVVDGNCKVAQTPVLASQQQCTAVVDWWQFLEQQHEQTLAAQDALFQKLEWALSQSLPPLAVTPAMFNSGRYHVPPQPRAHARQDDLKAVINASEVKWSKCEGSLPVNSKRMESNVLRSAG
jgi:hypothetical protein